MKAKELACVQDICASELFRWLSESVTCYIQDEYYYFCSEGGEGKKYWSYSHEDWMPMTLKERKQAFAVIDWFVNDPEGFFEAALTPEVIEKALNRLKDCP